MATEQTRVYDLMKRQCQPIYYAFDILWLNGRDPRELSRLERKKILRKVIPRISNSVGCVSYVEKDAGKLFELVKKSDLDGLVVKHKDGKYCQRRLWYKILNPAFTQKEPRRIFQRQ
jgi:ATP-dependent DNA ligase